MNWVDIFEPAAFGIAVYDIEPRLNTEDRL
jgi:hypothetical protein